MENSCLRAELARVTMERDILGGQMEAALRVLLVDHILPLVAQFVRIARKARLGYDDFLYISQQVRKKLGLRRGRKERRLLQLLANGDLKRFFRGIQECGDVQHEILLKLIFYTAVRVSELVHIEVGDVDLEACKIFINSGKGAKDRYILFPASFRLVLKSHLRATPHNRYLFETRRFGPDHS